MLQKADLICAEDTRVSAQLLSAYGIQAKLVSVREHNEQQMAGKIIAALGSGQIVAQISDAGTPAVCEPGQNWWRECAKRATRPCLWWARLP